jgi:uncharacterized beta-barrel protein YwiB (DUF1934 family)
MRNIDIKFTMTSLDSKARFNTTGEFKENRIIFNDDEGNRHFIIMQSDSVEYHKRGSMNMKYVFSLKHSTNGTYEIDGNKFLFTIKTKELKTNNNEIIIKYDLLLDDEIINESTLLIKYR